MALRYPAQSMPLGWRAKCICLGQRLVVVCLIHLLGSRSTTFISVVCSPLRNNCWPPQLLCVLCCLACLKDRLSGKKRKAIWLIWRQVIGHSFVRPFVPHVLTPSYRNAVARARPVMGRIVCLGFRAFAARFLRVDVFLGGVAHTGWARLIPSPFAGFTETFRPPPFPLFRFRACCVVCLLMILSRYVIFIVGTAFSRQRVAHECSWSKISVQRNNRLLGFKRETKRF